MAAAEGLCIISLYWQDLTRGPVGRSRQGRIVRYPIGSSPRVPGGWIYAISRLPFQVPGSDSKTEKISLRPRSQQHLPVVLLLLYHRRSQVLQKYGYSRPEDALDSHHMVRTTSQGSIDSKRHRMFSSSSCSSLQTRARSIDSPCIKTRIPQ